MKQILSLIVILISGISFGQYNGNPQMLHHGMFELVQYELPVNGSPFIDEIYKKGKIHINIPDSTMTEERLMRFNAFRGDIEYLTDTGQAQKLLKRENITVELDGRIFEVHPYRQRGEIYRAYFIPMNEGNVVLYKRPLKNFKIGDSPDNGYDQVQNPEYFDASTYYLSFNKSGMVEVNLRKRDLLKALEDQRAALSEFISENKLKFKDESDALKVVDYYNSLSSIN